MNRLKNFTTETQYDIAKDNFVYTTVSYLEDVDEVRYMTQRDKYKREYLTFEALEDGTFTLRIPAYVDSASMTSVSYSTDDGENWTTTNVNNTTQIITTPTITQGNKVLWKGVGKQISKSASFNGFSYFSSTGNFNVRGNIMSLLYGDDFQNNTSFNSGSNYNFSSVFKNATKLINVVNLILPATKLIDYCYQYMFSGCSSLTETLELPATTLAIGCYGAMFSDCTALTTAPKLPVTILTELCYAAMFSGCSSLITAPELPATSLSNSCYQYMFSNCTSLTEVPKLPVTELAYNCYYGMFSGCSSLTKTPELPATTLTEKCYDSMFNGCTSLIIAPILPATELVSQCYNRMFRGCSKLNYIKAMFTTTPSTTYTQNWVDGVAATGTFIKNPMATWNVTGVNGVPTGWSVYNWDPNYDYFTTEAINNSVFTFSIPSSISTSTLSYVEYSTDNGQTWVKTNNVNSTAVTVTTPTITAGNSVKWRCMASALATSSYRSKFSSSGRYNVSGNVMSLVGCTSGFSSTYALSYLFYNSTNLVSAGNLSLPATRLADYCYSGMFQGCTSLTTAPELPATTLAYSCYYYMFNNCTSLTTPPELPATTLASNCYYYMFGSCTSLTTAPELPATTLAYSCYYYMFNSCSSLTTAPELPATTLAHQCYEYMFQGCTSLTTAPELPATTLASNCYAYMFQNCTSLTTAPELPATTLVDWCYNYMFFGCTSLTTAPVLPATTLANYCYYHMFRGCTSLTTAPELPATTLTNYCYTNMFDGCSNLNYIKAMFTTTPGSSYTSNWVRNVAASGTFVKSPAAEWNVTGNNGVPSGWVVDRAWPDNIDYNYFTTEAIENSAFTLTIPSNLSTSQLQNIEYSTNNGRTWVKTGNVSNQQVVITTPTITAGNSVKWRGIGSSLNGSNFSSSGRYNVSGNIMTLISNADRLSQPNTFKALFIGSRNLVSAEDLILSATTLTQSCYYGMFDYCASLTTAPELPATTLAKNCYATMFEHCTSLTTAPYLPAITLEQLCYDYMFYGCSNLNYIKAMFTTTPSGTYTSSWVSGVAATGTFVKSPAAEWNVTGINGVPTGWTIEGQAIMKMWIDDFPGVGQIKYALEDPEDSGANLYGYTGDTITYNGQTCYLWQDQLGNGAIEYLLTSTNDYSTLSNQSIKTKGIDAEFTSLVAFLEDDAPTVYNDTWKVEETRLISIENSGSAMEMWIDDFFITPNADFVEDPEGSGSNLYFYAGDTMTYNGNTYYVWISGTEGAPTRILTTSVDYDTLAEQSIKESGSFAEFTSFFAALNSDNSIKYDTEDSWGETIQLIKIENV